MSSDCERHDDNPAWARGLKKYGNYYEGIVESAELALEMHKQETVTTFGVRRTEKSKSSPAIHSNKENENNENNSNNKLKVTKHSLSCIIFFSCMHYNNSQKLPPKYTGSKQLVTQLLNLMAYHFVQSEHRNIIAPWKTVLQAT